MNQELLDRARLFVQAPVEYSFTPREQLVLNYFFTNTDRKVFFTRNLPPGIVSALLAMYSRLKNSRGLRGHFVDSLLPLLLTSFLERFRETPSEELEKLTRFLAENKLKTLDAFCDFSPEHQKVLDKFLEATGIDPDYLKRLADSLKIKAFLNTWLDAFGHNSIARTAQFVIGVEDISLLAAKSIEWGRPGAGYIELSTRYVDFSQKPWYPIVNELDALDGEASRKTHTAIKAAVSSYQKLMGKNFDGLFPRFLEEKWRGVVDEKDLRRGVVGESCDVLGNLLPAAALTSVGVSISGEAFPELIKHLIIDNTPENLALAELILREAEKIGAKGFARHLEISEWRRTLWSYLDEKAEWSNESLMMPRKRAERQLFDLFVKTREFRDCRDFREVIKKLNRLKRSEYDKLPNQFETITATFAGKISFRSWRDFQRQSFCTHSRTYLTPLLGFYRYPKPAPPDINEVFAAIHYINMELWQSLRDKNIPIELCQYPMAIGNLTGFQASANLRQWEFCDWQRTKFSVNDEVRKTFLNFERKLRNTYPWWTSISRADMTARYVFARGNAGIPLF